LEDENKELCDEPEEKLSNEEKELHLAYTKKFIKEDLMNIIRFCYLWDGTNSRWFKSKLPEDIVFEVLGLINEGRRKCYSKSYRNFKNSVYYHVKNALLTFFRCKKKQDINDDSPESLFTLNEAEIYFEDGTYADDAEDILQRIKRSELREALFSVFDPNVDIEELFVLEEILKGNKRNEIAAYLGMTESDVTNIRKKVFRKIEKNLSNEFAEGM